MIEKWNSIYISELLSNKDAEVKTGPFGTQLHASDYTDAGTPVINARNIGFGEIRVDKLEYISDTTVKRLSSHLLKQGDIVFGRKGTVERHLFVKEQCENWFQGTDCLRLRITCDFLLPRFVSYCLLTDVHKQWIMNQSSHGATMTSLNQDIIGRIKLPLPPLEKQKSIVRVLTTYDDLIENNNRRIQILEEMVYSIYQEWFVNLRFPGYENTPMVESELGLIPVNWEINTIREFADVFRGKSYTSKNLIDKGGLPFINLKCIQRFGGFRLDGLKRFSGEYKEIHIAKTGEIVMAVTDMTQERMIVARAARIPDFGEGESIVSMDLVRIVSKDKNENSYLYSYFRFSDFADNVKQYANGANVLHLNPERIEEYKFIKPTKGIIKEFCQIIDPIFKMIDILNNSINNLCEQRDLLLPKLISGEIEV